MNILVLDNIRSVLNVGAIFRTSDAIGVDEIWLVGFSPTPIDRFGRERNDFQKSSLGAHKFVPWKYFTDDELKNEILKRKDEGWKIFSIEQSNDSIDYKKAKLGTQNIFIFGNENLGVKKELMELSDQILEIPMRGKKESLNVATSVGIVLFRLLD